MIALSDVSFVDPGIWIPGATNQLKSYFRGSDGEYRITYDPELQFVHVHRGKSERCAHISRVRDFTLLAKVKP